MFQLNPRTELRFLSDRRILSQPLDVLPCHRSRSVRRVLCHRAKSVVLAKLKVRSLQKHPRRASRQKPYKSCYQIYRQRGAGSL